MGDMLHFIMECRFERSGGKPYVFQARQGIVILQIEVKHEEKLQQLAVFLLLIMISGVHSLVFPIA
ncbi:hypothetical protein B9T28_03995 [Acinetobacter silvestris]|uniref:Uncharacterized protein n=1 Tax=Acinetobacter silvestris TaxID=1977882 RepID=A0A1Y3CH14_9GAMM|nr:hypothetical protein B9T28_03995 [Acinetobacter silvestris]